MNLAPSGLDLLLDARAHVARLDHRAEALGGRDRLQAGDADTEDHDARGLHRAGGRHQHREEALVGGRSDHHGLVAGDVGLRREHVHALRACRARRRLERKAGQAGGRDPREAVLVEGVEHADECGPALHRGQLVPPRDCAP